MAAKCIRTAPLLLAAVGCLGAGVQDSSAVVAPVLSELAAAEALARLDSLLAADAAAAVGYAEAGARFADDPVHGWSWQQRWGVALLRVGRVREAVPRLENAIRMAPYIAENHRNLATALMELERPGRAVAEFEQAVELAPDDPRLRLEYGQALSALGLDQDALRELQTAAHLCEGCVEASRALALFHMAGNRPVRAKPYLDHLNRADPTDWSRKSLALAYLRQGQPDSASLILETIAPDERDSEAWSLLAEADRERGRGERWLGLVRESRPGFSLPSDLREQPTFWAVIAEALRRDGRFEDALAAIDSALVRAPGDTVFLVNRIVLLEELGRESEREEAVERLRAAREPAEADRP
jgi:tetratricopeptide (TPR) repeat protein